MATKTNTSALLTNAAKAYWNTDTDATGHLTRAEHFTDARNALIDSGAAKNKTEAHRLIAERVAALAPAHSKKFGAPTVNQYCASFTLFIENAQDSVRTAKNAAELYAVVHKAYAASMGVENIKAVLTEHKTVPAAVKAVSALQRPDETVNEDGTTRTRARTSEISLKQALSALARIQEKESWSDDEKAQLYEASLATAVAVQPSQDDNDEE